MPKVSEQNHTPLMRDFKLLKADGKRAGLAIRTQSAKVAEAAKVQTAALLKTPAREAETMAHIPYFSQLRRLAACMAESGADQGAKEVLKKTLTAIKARKVLASVIEATETQARPPAPKVAR